MSSNNLEILEIAENSNENITLTVEPIPEESPVVEPIPEESVVIEPISEESTDLEPIPEESPVVEPIPEESAHLEPIVEESPVVEPIVEESADLEPIVEESAHLEPIVEESTDVEYIPEESPVVEPISEEPHVLEPIPKLIFILPYRNREQQQIFFDAHMKRILEDMPITDYKIKYIHQTDDRSFNRGAMKNIGFLYVKNKYPNHYKNITLIFNDIDTMPYAKNFLNYETTLGNVKHFYGYKFTLGGIVSIKGEDYEKTNGFPNYWSWGFEDNAFQKRVQNANLMIDRSQFYPIMDDNILQMKDGLNRLVNRNEFERYVDEYKYNVINDGFSNITNLVYEEDSNHFINVSKFETGVSDKPETNEIHNLKNGNIPFAMGRRRGMMRMSF